jgi:hypothetical protein
MHPKVALWEKFSRFSKYRARLELGSGSDRARLKLGSGYVQARLVITLTFLQQERSVRQPGWPLNALQQVYLSPPILHRKKSKEYQGL